MVRDLLIIVFYVDVRGLPATMLEKRLEFWEKKYSMDFSRDILKRYEIKTMFIPSVGETKVELLYPKVTQDTQEEKKILTMVNEIELTEKPIPPSSQAIKEGEDPVKIINQGVEKSIEQSIRTIYEGELKWLEKIKNKLKR